MMMHLDTLQKATGDFNWIKRYSVGDQLVTLQNNATISWRGYDRVDKLRGANYGYVCLDEIEWSESDPIRVYETILPAIRVPCPRPTFALATSPNGLRGLTALFRRKQLENDPNFYVARATSYANPHIDPEVVESCKSTMSKQRFETEILALASRPHMAIYDQFAESTHIINHRKGQSGSHYIIGIDWGLNKAALIAVEVLEDGTWVVIDEQIEKPLSRGHFRDSVRGFIKKVCGDRLPFMISADRAVPVENQWVMEEYGRKKVICTWLESKRDQYVTNGIRAVQDMLAPMEGPPKLLFSADLSRIIGDGQIAGIIPAMHNYRFKVNREGLPMDTVYKDDIHDHIQDCLRYLVVAGLQYKQLHGGVRPNRMVLGADGFSRAPVERGRVRII